MSIFVFFFSYETPTFGSFGVVTAVSAFSGATVLSLVKNDFNCFGPKSQKIDFLNGFALELGETPVAIVYGDFEAYILKMDYLLALPSAPPFSSSTGITVLYCRLLAPNLPPATIGPFLP
jgi:hypothetical protein